MKIRSDRRFVNRNMLIYSDAAFISKDHRNASRQLKCAKHSCTNFIFKNVKFSRSQDISRRILSAARERASARMAANKRVGTGSAGSYIICIMRGWNSRVCNPCSSDLFQRFLAHEIRATKFLCARQGAARFRFWGTGRVLGCILLFLGRRISPFTTENVSRAKECSDVKRGLLRSIFAKCTCLNANRARGNSGFYCERLCCFGFEFFFITMPFSLLHALTYVFQ